jgi:two-component system response regulator AtoC
MSDHPVLLVSTDTVVLGRLAGLVRDRGYEPVVASSRADVTAALARARFAFTLADLGQEGDAGAAWLEALTAQRELAGAIIVLSGDRDIDPIAAVMSLGVDRVIRRSLDPEHLEHAITDVLSGPRYAGPRIADDSPAAVLRREVTLWRSDKMRAVWKIIEQAASIDVTVLISGETGTGKDLVARAIHHLSGRQRAPYVAVNCAAVPRDLLESELFGHERGAFTGAHQLRTGKFESADHGTIFLDEIGDLHPALQAKLLHVLHDGTFCRIGGKSAMKVDVRVLAATNRDLALAVSTERFRDDLYYRLNVIHIEVPPLRERREEIPVLAAYFVQRYSKLYRREGFQPSAEAMERLMRHQYPGNVRELENVIKRMIVLGDAHLARTSFPSQRTPGQSPHAIDVGQLPAVFLKDIARKAAERAEREEILKMLERTRWNRARTAKALNISYRSLLYKMKGAGLDRIPPAAGVRIHGGIGA